MLRGIFIILSMLAMACSTQDQKVVYRERATSRIVESRLDSIYRDSVMVFFEQGFNSTSIEIKNGSKLVYANTISTHSELQVATVINVGSGPIQEFVLNVDGGRDIVIRIAPPNKHAAVNYYSDTVYVDYLRYYPMYE